MSGKFVVSLIENPVWGYILQPVSAVETEYGSLLIQEIIERKSSCFALLTAEQKAIVSHYEKYTEHTLMKNFSKEKYISDFRKTVSPEKIERYIRPAIETVHKKIVAIIRQTNVPVYLRENIRTRNLHDSNRIIVTDTDSEVIFNFRKEESGELIYFIQVKSGNKVIDLKSRFFAVLHNEPAIVIIDDKLFTFNDIDAKKLQPFITKDNIRVNAASYRTYIEKFVVNCVKKYEVRYTGFTINDVEPQKQALLNLICDLNMQPVLYLSVRYDKKVFQLNNFSTQNIVYTEDIEGDIVINRYKRDTQWERSLIELLLTNGLKQKDICMFYAETADNADYLDRTGAIIKWIRSNHDVMKNFEFSQSLSKTTYSTGKIETVTVIRDKQDWFDLNCVVVIDGFKIPFSNFRDHIINGIREYVLPDKTVVILPDEWFASFQDIMHFGKKSGNDIRLNRRYFKLLDNLELPEKSSVRNLEQFEDIPVPKEICRELYHYQKKGFSWLVHLHKNNFGGCLADDMGLGKTLQTIAFMQYLANEKTQASENEPVSLIIVPTSLIFNWQNELKDFAPSLRVYPYTGKNRLKDVKSVSVFSNYDVIIASYAMVRIDIEIFAGFTFHNLILDESQYIKNPGSQTYKAIRQIAARHRLLLSGTPIENSLTDLWAQFNIINEGMLGSLASFRKRYINPIKQDNERQEKALLHMIQPFMLRRTKSEVAPELPPITEKVVYCDMCDEQAEYYEIEKNKIRNNLISDEVMYDPKQISFIALQALMRLRLLANHPQFVDEQYTGSSGKFEQVIMYIERLIAENHKALIFSSFVKHLQLFADYFDKNNRKYAWLSGKTPERERENEINRFISDEQINCFLISLKAGSVGLNLTIADYVFIIDPWWNPAAEMQAISRSHRIGQNKNVMVYRFISTKTIEEKIRRLQESKSKLAGKFITSANPLNAMSKEEIEQLFENED
jgi:SNF2 family DNA or RNA helicase